MKILFAGYRNPLFITLTEYTERAFAEAGADVSFFSDRDFLLPGRVRDAVPLLAELDLNALNRRLLRAAEIEKPDVFFACGGHRVLPETLSALRSRGVKTVLWTIDPPTRDFRLLTAAAPYYEKIFCGGSEAMELMAAAGIRHASWLPFGCDPEFHRPRELSGTERLELGADICFVGTVNPVLYPQRVSLLESVSDLGLKAWGPGASLLPPSSPLRQRVRGGEEPAGLWTKIYSASRIVLCSHYADREKLFPCYQASPRVFEALACGAFLLCDAQRDVLSLFEDGRHLVVYRGAADLREKASYYLANSAAREAIASAGRKEALERHTYLQRVKVVLASLAC